jgi:hypothetical protein
MKIYFLYVKTHKETGLKYLGQTCSDPYKYLGSGKDWKIHLKKNGNNIHTEILLETSDWDDLTFWGRYYSSLWNVVNAMDDFGNKIWANKIRETGGGGWEFINKNKLGDRTGAKLTYEQRKNVSIGKLASVTDKYRETLSRRASGVNNPNYKNEILEFFNVDTKEIFIGTRIEFRNHTGLRKSTISNLITGVRKTYKKWSFINNLQD